MEKGMYDALKQNSDSEFLLNADDHLTNGIPQRLGSYTESHAESEVLRVKKAYKCAALLISLFKENRTESSQLFEINYSVYDCLNFNVSTGCL